MMNIAAAVAFTAAGVLAFMDKPPSVWGWFVFAGIAACAK